MDLLYPRCAGLDVHATTVVACARIATGGTVTYERLTVSTSTRGLLQLADWLTAKGVTHAAMEATGVYWKPVWHVLESAFTLTLAHAQHIRNIPGRKSDKNDATWILAGAGADPRQLRPADGHSGVARSDADPQAVGPGGGAPHTAPAEDPRRRPWVFNRADVKPPTVDSTRMTRWPRPSTCAFCGRSV